MDDKILIYLSGAWWVELSTVKRAGNFLPVVAVLWALKYVMMEIRYVEVVTFV
jgi:hypothetical protein